MPWRRRRSGLRRLRDGLIEHRLGVAEVGFGAIAGTLGLWLMWPTSGGEGIDRSAQSEQSATIERATLEATVLDVSEDATLALGGDGSTPSGTGGTLEAPALSAELEPSPEARPAEIAPLQRRAPSARPLIARLRDLRVSREPETRDQAAQPETERAQGTPPRLNRAGLRGEAVVGWQPRPQVPSAKPQQETVLAALPVIRPEGEDEKAPAWVRNAAVPPRVHDRPMIAVVIDDLGMNRRNTAAVNELPGPLTLAFLPYANALEEQSRAARAAGHELLVHMPMEPIGEDWPGPEALLTSLEPDQFQARLRANLESFSGFVGLNNHMGSLLTADREHMATIMAELRRRGLLFLDSKTTARSIASDEAERRGVPFVERDVFLDNQSDAEHIARQLERAEQVAREQGAAVVIGHPHDLTLRALGRWLPELERRGFALVPISTLTAQRNCAGETSMPGCGALRLEPSVGAVAGATPNRQG